MSEYDWQVEDLDLAGYLERVGVAAREPSREALDELHAAHVRTFPFENIDVLLRQHPGVALKEVQAKFVNRGRGGYCFEHGTLFSAVLERLGYRIERRLGRVGDPALTPRTHFTIVVTLAGRRYLADPGFGMTPLRPVLLEDGVEDDQDGWRFRVRRVDTGPAGPAWELHRLRSTGWELMHTTDELPVRPVDVVMGHHFTSTHPSSHFTRGLSVARHGDGRHAAASVAGVTIRIPGEPTRRRPLAAHELPDLLDGFGVRVTPEELARVLRMWPSLKQ